MEIINLDGISFPVAKYTICRVYHFGNGPYRDTFYAPADMKFFKYEDRENENLIFEGKNITQQFWIGITEWSEEKERISHNLHFEFKRGDEIVEKDDFPVINSPSVEVHNARNKYLVWELKDICTLPGEEFPIMDKPGNFKEPIYFVKKAKSKDLEDGISLMFADLVKSGSEVTPEIIKKFKSMVYKPYQYVRINGVLENGQGYDVTTVTIASWCIHVNRKINRIERDTFEYRDVPVWDRFAEIEDCSKEEFEKVFDETLNTIRNI